MKCVACNQYLNDAEMSLEKHVQNCTYNEGPTKLLVIIAGLLHQQNERLATLVRHSEADYYARRLNER